jgi:hypothetical protein
MFRARAKNEQSAHHGPQTPFSDQLAFAWEGGMWEYDAQHNSLMTAGNGGAKPTRAALTLFYNQGTARYDLEQALQAGDQMWIDVGKLIREHVPDKNGKVLPADLSSGSYEFRDLNDKIAGTLFEGKVVFEKTYGHVTYGCMTCCDYTGPYLTFDPLGIPFLGTSPNGVWATDCNLNDTDVSSKFYGNWTTANTAIATVGNDGTHTGVAVGPTSSDTLGALMTQHGRICYNTQQHASGTDNVTPHIDSISPSRGLIGATTSSVTITGKGFTGGHVNTPAAIQVNNITSFADNKIVLDLIISDTATPGNNVGAIYVSVSSQNSNKIDFYVQVPTSLSVVSGSATGTTEKLCTSNPCGTIVSFKYQVNDQDSPAQPIRNVMSFWDSFGTFSPDGLGLQGTPLTTTCSPNQSNSGPCNANTNTDGTFTEAVLGGFSLVCCVGGVCTTGGPSDVTQT